MKTKRSFIAFRDAYTPFMRITNMLEHSDEIQFIYYYTYMYSVMYSVSFFLQKRNRFRRHLWSMGYAKTIHREWTAIQ